MAVIITNMNMPRGCFECPLREEYEWEGDWCAVCEGCDLIGETTRPNYCPLRSADEMIAEIESQKEYEYKMGNMGIFAGLATSLGYIHKCCNKEQPND